MTPVFPAANVVTIRPATTISVLAPVIFMRSLPFVRRAPGYPAAYRCGAVSELHSSAVRRTDNLLRRHESPTHVATDAAKSP